MAEPTKAVQGRTFQLKPHLGGNLGYVEVKAACEVKDNGHWYCITHSRACHNNFDKDSHISEKGEHELCWMCHEHGPEVP